MRQTLRGIAKFLVVMVLMTILNSIVWEYVAGDLYDCTDGGVPGYWSPGYWIHGWAGHPVAVVRQVVHGRSMSEPDTIQEGWSVNGLLCLWLSFLAVSIIISVALARLRWIPRRQIKTKS